MAVAQWSDRCWVVTIGAVSEGGGLRSGPLREPETTGPQLPPYLERLEARRWTGFSPEERRDALQELENYTAYVQGRKPRWVVPDPGMNSQRYGAYDGRYIRLNPKLLEDKKPYRAMQTVLHEGRHAFQRDVVKGLPAPGVSAETVQAWRDNFQVRSTPEKSAYHDYYFQPKERDAVVFATGMMNMLAPLFSADPGYAKFLRSEATKNARYEREAIRSHGHDYSAKIDLSISRRASRLWPSHQKNEKMPLPHVSVPVPAGLVNPAKVREGRRHSLQSVAGSGPGTAAGR